MNVEKAAFKDYVHQMEDVDTQINKLVDLFGYTAIDSGPAQCMMKLAGSILELMCGEDIEESDLIEMWLYEDMKEITDNKGKVISLKTVDELYDFLTEDLA